MGIPFKPNNAFEGFVFSELCHLKKVIGNHLKHHWFIEGGLLLLILSYAIKKWFL